MSQCAGKYHAVDPDCAGMVAAYGCRRCGAALCGLCTGYDACRAANNQRHDATDLLTLLAEQAT